MKKGEGEIIVIIIKYLKEKCNEQGDETAMGRNVIERSLRTVKYRYSW